MTKITIRRKDVEDILEEIKTAPKWKIKKWAEQTRRERKYENTYHAQCCKFEREETIDQVLSILKK